MTDTPGAPPRESQGGRSGAPKRRRRRDRPEGPVESEPRWRDLAGNSPSVVGVGGAMRARDVNRPSEQDIMQAEADVVLVRRQWQPPPG